MRYDRYANELVFGAVEAAGEGALDTPVSGGRGTVRATLQHLLQTPANWYAGMAQAPPPELTLDTLDGMRRSSAAVHNALDAHAASVTDSGWSRYLERTLADGTVQRSGPLWRVVAHLANHGTQHRAEAGMALAAVGHSPGDMDMVYFAFADQLS
jgi:uncharacterized damage-inducible protein DinB